MTDLHECETCNDTGYYIGEDGIEYQCFDCDPSRFVKVKLDLSPLPPALPEVPAWIPVYTADQMRVAIAAERERCAKLCESMELSSYSRDCPSAVNGHWPDQVFHLCAAKIRGEAP